MDVEEKRDRLYQIAASDSDPARRAEARQRLARLPTKTAETGRPPVDLGRGGAEDTVELQPGQRPNLASRINFNQTLNAGADALGRSMSTATVGGTDLLADTVDYARGQPGASRGRRGGFVREHPMLAGAASAAGAFAPGAPIKAAAGGIERGIDAAAESIPALRSLLGLPFVGSVARGAAVGGTLGAAQAANENSDHPLDAAAQGAKSGAVVGGAMGGVGSVARGGASLLRNEDIALLEKYGLEPSPIPGVPVVEQGQGPIDVLASRVRGEAPPTGTNAAGPAARQTAALQSAEEIARDIAAREGANDTRLGQLRAGNRQRYGGSEPPRVRGTAEEPPDVEDGQTVEVKVPESMAQIVYGDGAPPDVTDANGRIIVGGGWPNGRPPPNTGRVPVRPVLDALDALRHRADLPDTTRGRLAEVGNRVREIAPPTKTPAFDPELVVTGDGMTAGKVIDMLSKGMARTPPPQRPALQAEIDRVTKLATKEVEGDPGDATANPIDLQGIKRLARNLGNQDKIQGVTASDAALRSVADTVNGALPEEMQAQDRDYHEARSRTERAKESIGLSRKGTIPLEEEVPLTRDDNALEPGEDGVDFSDPRTVESAANHLARRGENTKAGANATRRTQRLYDEGMPEVMPGATAPDQIDVRSLMDRPRLQLAQEHLQLNPSAVFSGGGVSGAASRAVKAGSRRFVYPVLKDLGNADVGPPAAGVADIVQLLRLRSKLLDEEQARKGVDAGAGAE